MKPQGKPSRTREKGHIEHLMYRAGRTINLGLTLLEPCRELCAEPLKLLSPLVLQIKYASLNPQP